MNIVRRERSPTLERLEVVQKLRAYFEAMQAIGPVPEVIHLWPQQLDLLRMNGACTKKEPHRLRVDGLPAVTLIEHIEIDERVIS